MLARDVKVEAAQVWDQISEEEEVQREWQGAHTGTSIINNLGICGGESREPLCRVGRACWYKRPGGAVQRKDSYQVKEFISMSLSWVQGRQAGRQWFLLGVQAVLGAEVRGGERAALA